MDLTEVHCDLLCCAGLRVEPDMLSEKYMDLTELLGIAGVPTFLFIHPEGQSSALNANFHWGLILELLCSHAFEPYESVGGYSMSRKQQKNSTKLI